jgi:hypothetical protein
LTYDAETKTITIKPALDLNYGQEYFLKVRISTPKKETLFSTMTMNAYYKELLIENNGAIAFTIEDEPASAAFVAPRGPGANSFTSDEFEVRGDEVTVGSGKVLKLGKAYYIQFNGALEFTAPNEKGLKALGGTAKVGGNLGGVGFYADDAMVNDEGEPESLARDHLKLEFVKILDDLLMVKVVASSTAADVYKGVQFPIIGSIEGAYENEDTDVDYGSINTDSGKLTIKGAESFIGFEDYNMSEGEYVYNDGITVEK